MIHLVFQDGSVKTEPYSFQGDYYRLPVYSIPKAKLSFDQEFAEIEIKYTEFRYHISDPSGGRYYFEIPKEVKKTKLQLEIEALNTMGYRS